MVKDKPLMEIKKMTNTQEQILSLEEETARAILEFTKLKGRGKKRYLIANGKLDKSITYGIYYFIDNGCVQDPQQIQLIRTRGIESFAQYSSLRSSQLKTRLDKMLAGYELPTRERVFREILRQMST